MEITASTYGIASASLVGMKFFLSQCMRGNPMKHTDSSGHFIDTAMDVISIGMGVYDIYNNGLNWENGLSLAADVASLADSLCGWGWACCKSDATRR